ncbi:MAG TPA: nucleotidyltransferase family protein [Gemmatimonadaceae bacterium]|nr:nucleotidyltransferase family protein [Gemmatimonadaceae bacterium]
MSANEPGAREAVALVRLCFATTADRVDELGNHDWPALLERAERERCAGLAWLRGASVLRALAPVEATSAWRASALRLGMAVGEQLEQLAELLRAFESSGVQAGVLKGFPLAQRLYGDPCVRPVADVDLYVPLAQRQAAHEALLASGFSHRSGEAPHEGCYHRAYGSKVLFAEVHSAVLDEVLLSHLKLPPPELRAMDVGGVRMYACDGPLLPVFLGLHLAKHSSVPLLWWVDFATLWTQLSDDERRAAGAVAHACGATRHLEWATRGVSYVLCMVESAPLEAAAAASALAAMHQRHVALRVMKLAASVADRARSLLAWVWPPQLRAAPIRYFGHVVTRLTQLARRIPRRTHAQRGEQLFVRGYERALSMDDDELLGLARTVIDSGSTMWLRVRGRSMGATIPDGAIVLIEPIERPLAKNDVVLAAYQGAKAVVHRIRDVCGDSIVLQGDAMATPDRPIHRSAVVGRVALVRLYDHTRPPTRRVGQTLRMTVRRLRGALARRVVSSPTP